MSCPSLFSPQLFGLFVLNCNWNKVFQKREWESPSKKTQKEQKKEQNEKNVWKKASMENSVFVCGVQGEEKER